MAVHTVLDDEELHRLAREFGLPAPSASRGLAAGSVNTNYELRTAAGRFFLTLREGKSEEEARGEVSLLAQLAEARFPCPRPVAGPHGPVLRSHDRPVLCFHWVQGEERAPAQLSTDALADLGRQLARLHRVGEASPWQRENPHGAASVARWLTTLRAPASRPDVAAVLATLPFRLEAIVAARDPLLPRGVGHLDVFPDNVTWLGERVACLFDFEMAGRDALMLDLAITLLAFGFDEAGRFDPARLAALAGGYVAERPPSERERAGLFAECRLAALRYTVSRIRDFELSELPPERLRRKDFRRWLARLDALEQLGPSGLRALLGGL